MTDEPRKIRVDYYAILREERGCSTEEVDTRAGSALELFTELKKRHGFSVGHEQMKVVINEEFSDWSKALCAGDTIVFVPPVAGGAPDSDDAIFALHTEALDPEALKEALRQDRSGACVTFEGWVRDRNDGRDVTRLEYEAFGAMAEKEGKRILEEAQAKFNVDKACCVHRQGDLAIGDMAVWVGVTAAHRGEAFDACRYIIDEIKHRVPIWKKEHYAEGDSGWVNSEVPSP